MICLDKNFIPETCIREQYLKFYKYIRSIIKLESS